ncbi:MAG: class I SAM-dependent methyltransferase [Pleurocapsa sp. MO_226.B13]|nr:class I SAM-dependent methyltransferase [Pleurocapsa sp. MO_226.B13]
MATDLLTCITCQSLSPQKIANISNGWETFIDFRPDLQNKSLKLESEKQKTFTTQLFGNSFFPWFYEKILPAFWAMGLRGWGGIEKEALEVSEFFGRDPETVMDLSCGTGIMARKLAKSRSYQLIIALDYSESMLKMLIDQIRLEKTTNTFENLVVIRGDAESIPLISNSIDAIYAGAAMHCWSNPQKAIEEVYRVLRPGGKIFATTFTKFLPEQKLYCFSIEELWSLFQKAGFKQKLLEIKSEGIYITIKGNK